MQKYRVVVEGFLDKELALEFARVVSASNLPSSIEVDVEEMNRCDHQKYRDGYCAEMSCPNYYEKRRSETPRDPSNYPPFTNR